MKVGIITSGGDSPGMNATVNTIHEELTRNNIKVIMYRGGFLGIKNSEYVKYKRNLSNDINNLGGSYIGCGRYPELKEKESQEELKEIIKKENLDYLVVIGGNGSFKGAKVISGDKTKIIGIPGTIDNDVNASDYSIGIDSAANAAADSIEQIVRCSISHKRFYIIQAMGGTAGQLSIETAIATNADGVFTHRYMPDVDTVSKIANKAIKEKGFGFIVMADLIYDNLKSFAKQIEEKTGIEIRVEILGRVQRGARPTPREKIMAMKAALKACEHILTKAEDHAIVAFDGNEAQLKNIERASEPLDYRHEDALYKLFKQGGK